jgi:hypothetical protein
MGGHERSCDCITKVNFVIFYRKTCHAIAFTELVMLVVLVVLVVLVTKTAQVTVGLHHLKDAEPHSIPPWGETREGAGDGSNGDQVVQLNMKSI